MIGILLWVLLLAEQLDGAVMPTEQGLPPALFRDVGPSVADWEDYLKDMADDMDQQHKAGSTDISKTKRNEDNLFLQVPFIESLFYMFRFVWFIFS